MFLCKVDLRAEQIGVNGIDDFAETKLPITLKESMCNSALRCCLGFTGVYSLYLFSSLFKFLLIFI